MTMKHADQPAAAGEKSCPDDRRRLWYRRRQLAAALDQMAWEIRA